MVCECRWDNPLNMNDYYNAAVTGDYLEAMREFTQRINAAVQSLESEREHRALPAQTLTAADCVPGGMDKDMKGKVVVIKPEVLTPEYRTSDHQLGVCWGGNGARPDARGSAVFIQNLYTGKQSRYERRDIAGVMDTDKLPAWAREKLAALTQEKEPSHMQKTTQKSSVLSALDDAKKQAASQTPGHTPKKNEPAL
jgi:hypothetical protein